MNGLIGRKINGGRDVSGAGGSCLYRAIAYQICEQANKYYNDVTEVQALRARTQQYLLTHWGDTVPGSGGGVRWRDIGPYMPGFAEAPVPQVMAHVIERPVTIHTDLGRRRYGHEYSRDPLHVRLKNMHYTICYP